MLKAFYYSIHFSNYNLNPIVYEVDDKILNENGYEYIVHANSERPVMLSKSVMDGTVKSIFWNSAEGKTEYVMSIGFPYETESSQDTILKRKQDAIKDINFHLGRLMEKLISQIHS